MIRFLSVLFCCAVAFGAGDIAGVTAHIGGTNQGGYGVGGTTISAGDIQTDDDLTVAGSANITEDISATNADFSGGSMTASTGLITTAYVTGGTLKLGLETPTPGQSGTAGTTRLSGNGAAGYAGGAALVYAGWGGDSATPGVGGKLTITGGVGGAHTATGAGGTGGDLELFGGYGGYGDTGGAGGNLILRGGTGGYGDTGGAGGNLILRGGTGGEEGAGTSGTVQITDELIYLGLPNLALPSYNLAKFAGSCGDGIAGGAGVIEGSSGASGTTAGGGAGGPIAFCAGPGGSAAAGSNANGGAGGTVYVCGGPGGAKDGSGTNGATGSVILGYNPLLTTTSGVAVCKAAPTAGVELDVNGDIVASTISASGGTITGITDLAMADGGTAASDAATARANLGITDRWTINILSTVVNKCTDTRLAINWWTAVADAGTQTGLSVYANTATYADSSDWTASQRIAKGSVWSLNPGTTDYLTIADAASLSFGNGSTDVAFTIASWFEVVNNGQVKPIVVKGDAYTYSANTEYAFYFDANENLYFMLCDPSVPARSAGRNTGIAYTGWHFAVGVYSGTGGSAGIQLYVDGLPITTGTYNTGSYTAMEDLSQDIGILGENDGGNSSGVCDLGFIVIDASAWTATTVRNVFEATRGWYGL